MGTIRAKAILIIRCKGNAKDFYKVREIKAERTWYSREGSLRRNVVIESLSCKSSTGAGR